MDYLQNSDLIQSIDISNNLQNIFKSGQGDGKSGSFFFFTSDGKFIIKTLRGNEKKNILNILDDLILHY